MIKTQVKEGKKNFLNILNRVKNRDLSGNTGLAIKNSAYQFSTNLIGKLGSLIFVMILARIILPETFGLYNLVLSTVMFFYIFSDLGTGPALVYFSSKSLNKKREKIKSYINYLLKIKLFLAITSAIILIALAKLISDGYYQKPIFLALIAGSIYLIFTSIQSFYMALAQSNNDFKSPMFKEIFLQISKIILILPVILYLKKIEISSSSSVLAIFIILSIISIFCMFLIYRFSTKNLRIENIKPTELTKKDKKEIKSFMFKITLTASSVLLLGNIDKIIIGPFVPSEFIGYYSAAFSMVSASAGMLILSDVFFPLFLRMKGKRLKRAFKKSMQTTLTISFLLFAFILIFANPLIKIILGQNYLQSISMLRVLALLAIFIPMIELYTGYIISKGNLGKITKIILFIVALSIILPLLFVKFFLNYGYTAAVFGLILGLLISKGIHLFYLVWISRKL